MTPTSLWAKLEAEGRLKWVAFGQSPDIGVDWWPSYWTLHLTEEERERLRYPTSDIPPLNNSQLWGES